MLQEIDLLNYFYYYYYYIFTLVQWNKNEAVFGEDKRIIEEEKAAFFSLGKRDFSKIVSSGMQGFLDFTILNYKHAPTYSPLENIPVPRFSFC